MKTYLGLKINQELKSNIEEQAQYEHRSVSNLVEIILKEGVVHRQKQRQVA